MSQEDVERACRLIEQVNGTGELGPDFDSFFHPEMEFEDEIGAYDTRDAPPGSRSRAALEARSANHLTNAKKRSVGAKAA